MSTETARSEEGLYPITLNSIPQLEVAPIEPQKVAALRAEISRRYHEARGNEFLYLNYAGAYLDDSDLVHTEEFLELAEKARLERLANRDNNNACQKLLLTRPPRSPGGPQLAGASAPPPPPPPPGGGNGGGSSLLPWLGFGALGMGIVAAFITYQIIQRKQVKESARKRRLALAGNSAASSAHA